MLQLFTSCETLNVTDDMSYNQAVLHFSDSENMGQWWSHGCCQAHTSWSHYTRSDSIFSFAEVVVEVEWAAYQSRGRPADWACAACGSRFQCKDELTWTKMMCAVLVVTALCLQADQVSARVSEERLCADPACTGKCGYPRPFSWHPGHPPPRTNMLIMNNAYKLL